MKTAQSDAHSCHRGFHAGNGSPANKLWPGHTARETPALKKRIDESRPLAAPAAVNLPSPMPLSAESAAGHRGQHFTGGVAEN